MRSGAASPCVIFPESTKHAQSFVKTGIEFAFTPVITGDKVSLGDSHLNLFSYAVFTLAGYAMHLFGRRKTLFSGDVFGCHFL